MAKITRTIRKATQKESLSPAPAPQTTPPPLSPEEKKAQDQVTKAFSSLVVSMRSLNTQVNSLTLPNQTLPLLKATMDQIDLNLGEVTDRMWALRSIIEAENGPEKA